MLTITFDMSFDQGHWPGPLANRNAAAGELWTGPRGLLNLIETFTGLRSPVDPRAVRVASLVPAVRATEGFWSRSAEVDPFGTAATLLKWRDYLRLHGWRGEKCGYRLAELARVTHDAPPGLPDRLLTAAQTISSINNTISELRLFEPPAEFPHTWRQVIDILEKTGTTISLQKIPPTRPAGDLAACRKASFSPAGDGSLQCLRPLTPGAAAQETAAWLSGLEDLSQTLIIGPDSTLDEALHRFGLPTTGAGIPIYDNSLLQILPLVLEMAWSPPDPQRALELLILPVSPIPRGIAFRLIRALQQYPAVGSEAWRQALAAGLQTISDPSRRKNLENRINAIFAANLSGHQYPAVEIKARLDLLRFWARGRMENKATEEAFNWDYLAAQLENAQRLVDLSGLQNFTAPQIRRIVHDITAESETSALYEDQAGLPHVDAPECLVGQAKNIVWWSFTRDAAQSVFNDPFSDDEKQALQDIGVHLPDPGQQAIRHAARWQRPLLLSRKRLILVCPENSNTNEEQHPHPLWDELLARLAPNAHTGLLETREIISSAKPPAEKRKSIALPSPVTELHIDPSLITHSESESPNSLSDLLSCPFRWVANYPGKLSGGLTATLSSPEELEGWFIHEILRQVLEKGWQTPETAAKTAGEIFDRDGPLLAAKFFLPGHDDLRARVKRNTETAANHLFRLIGQGGFTVGAVEKDYELSVRSLGIKLRGRPDLVLESPRAVIDFKRGGINFRQKEIANGTSVQLAVYGHLLRGEESRPFPPAAYFMLKAGELITSDSQTFPEAITIEGSPLADTWQAIKDTYKEIRQELDQGVIQITGNQEDAPAESEIKDGRLFLTPCAFCVLGVLCGQALETGL